MCTSPSSAKAMDIAALTENPIMKGDISFLYENNWLLYDPDNSAL
jgi:hypothetical protein